MGDRSNVVLRTKDEQIVFYGHWAGPALFRSAQKGIALDKGRWDDFQYLTAIVARQILGDFSSSVGITTKVWDNEYPILVLDVDKQEAYFSKEKDVDALIGGQFSDGRPIDGTISFEAFTKAMPRGGPDNDEDEDADEDEDETD